MSSGYNVAPMQRLVVAAACLALGSCTAPEQKTTSAFGGAEASLVAKAEAGAEQRPAAIVEAMTPAAPTTDPAADPTAELLSEVARLDAGEEHAQALRLLEEAIGRSSHSAELCAAKAGVLRDLGRRADAFRELSVLRDRDEGAFGPGLWFELADLACGLGEFDCAAAALASMRATVDGATYAAVREVDVQALERCVSRRETPRAVRVRDLLGDLRGAADPVRRLAALRLLERQPEAVRDLAHRIASVDADGSVRASVVTGARLERDREAEFCAVALTDPDSRVRRAGAARAATLAASDRVPLLIAALAAESDPETFAALDAGVCLGTDLVPMDERQAQDAAQRAALVTRRRKAIDESKERQSR